MKKVQNADFKEDRERKELMGNAEALARLMKDDPARACGILLAMIAVDLKKITESEAENQRLKAFLGVDEEDEE